MIGVRPKNWLMEVEQLLELDMLGSCDSFLLGQMQSTFRMLLNRHTMERS